MDKNSIVRSAVSTFDKYCDGYGNPGTEGNGYFLGVVLGCGVTDFNLSHDGSIMLDEIDAFDKAEVGQTTIGQINMTIVSSFCGLHGLIWGFDVIRANNIRRHLGFGPKSVVDVSGSEIPVYSIEPMVEATKELFGTVEQKRFPLIPGGHVPCASKNIKSHDESRIYASLAIGIPKDRSQNACLLMEDVGKWSGMVSDEEAIQKKAVVIEKLAQSILAIGKNQHVEYEEIFIGITDIAVRAGQVGCALVAAPYFVLAKNAIPNGDVDTLLSDDLHSWSQKVSLHTPTGSV